MITYLQAGSLLIAVLVINVMSLVDALSTLLLVDTDSYTEINPLMDVLMSSNYLYYFGVKLGITLIGTVICWHFYEQRSSARWAFKFIFRTYCAVMLWHVFLLAGLVK